MHALRLLNQPLHQPLAIGCFSRVSAAKTGGSHAFRLMKSTRSSDITTTGSQQVNSGFCGKKQGASDADKSLSPGQLTSFRNGGRWITGLIQLRLAEMPGVEVIEQEPAIVPAAHFSGCQ